MRRRVIVLLVGLLGVIPMLFSGCSRLLGLEDDNNKVDSTFSQLLDAIETKDESAVEALFARNIVAENGSFAQGVSDLLDFCNGKITSCNARSARITSENRNGSDYYKEISSTYDVETTESQYRFAMKFRVTDTIEPQNVGIASLYVTEFSNKENQAFAYWGDGNWTPGINIESKEISEERFSEF